jgi:hypothetical protein
MHSFLFGNPFQNFYTRPYRYSPSSSFTPLNFFFLSRDIVSYGVWVKFSFLSLWHLLFVDVRCLRRCAMYRVPYFGVWNAFATWFTVTDTNFCRPTPILGLQRYKHAEAVAPQLKASFEDIVDSQPELEENAEDQTTVPFSSLRGKVADETLDTLTGRNFRLKNMTPVQAEVLGLMPDLVSGGYKGAQDLLVKAKTGTGKTLAFLIPAVEARLKALAASKEPWKFAKTTVGALIISPTRELASQIAMEASKLTRGVGDMEVHLLTGGSDKGRQLREWRRGRHDIVVATPGRLVDLLTSDDGVRSALSQTGQV